MTADDEAGRPTVGAAQHPMVIAALARMGGSGGWARILAGLPVEDPLDRADTDLLVAAGVLRRDGERLVLQRAGSHYLDPDALSRAMTAELQQALGHARGEAAGWNGDDLDLVRNQGRGSAAAADLIADGFLPGMPRAAEALASGAGRFLDVGTGVAAIASRMCELFPGLTCVGLDVLPQALALASEELAVSGMADRVELRLQSVADLDDTEEFDLAWVPQLFIPPDAFTAGLKRVHAAMRPGGGLIVPTLAPPDGAEPMARAVLVHSGYVLGGGPVTRHEMRTLLSGIGFTDVEEHAHGHRTLLTAIRP